MEFNRETADKILERIANGESLKRIVEDKEFPSRSVVYEWLAVNKDFADKYARAREEQADSYADEIAAIADDESIPADSRRIRIDARKWVACKLKPKKYGDRVMQEVTGANGGPIENKVTVEFVNPTP